MPSVQGHANRNMVVACATRKGGIRASTRAQAVGAARDGIRVNPISPESVRTQLLEYAARMVAGEGNPIEEAIEGFGIAHPEGRVGTVKEASELNAFPCGHRAGSCTGGDYLIDGRLTAEIGVLRTGSGSAHDLIGAWPKSFSWLEAGPLCERPIPAGNADWRVSLVEQPAAKGFLVAGVRIGNACSAPRAA